MPLYTPEDPEFDAIAERFRWFENILPYEYGEAPAPEAIPGALNWVLMLPIDVQLGLDEADCSLAFVDDTGYTCSVWDVTGPDDLPWVTFLVDDQGPRLLPEYSLLQEEAEPDELQSILAAAADALPSRLLRGEFDRSGEPVTVPSFLWDEPPTES